MMGNCCHGHLGGLMSAHTEALDGTAEGSVLGKIIMRGNGPLKHVELHITTFVKGISK